MAAYASRQRQVRRIPHQNPNNGATNFKIAMLNNNEKEDGYGLPFEISTK